MVGTFLSSQPVHRSNEFTSWKHAAPRRRRRRRPRREDSQARGRDLRRRGARLERRRRASIARHFRGARELRSVERRFVGEAVYGLIRWRRRLAFAIGSRARDAAGALSRVARAASSRDDGRRSRPSCASPASIRRALADVDARLAEIADATSGWRSRSPIRLARRSGSSPSAAATTTEALLAAMNRRAPLTARANRLKNTREELAAILDEEGVPARAVAAGARRRSSCSTHVNAYGLDAFKDGRFELQDAGSPAHRRADRRRRRAAWSSTPAPAPAARRWRSARCSAIAAG